MEYKDCAATMAWRRCVHARARQCTRTRLPRARARALCISRQACMLAHCGRVRACRHACAHARMRVRVHLTLASAYVHTGSGPEMRLRGVRIHLHGS